MQKIIKILLQIAIIYVIYIIGNYISKIISPIIIIPGSLIGMMILFIFLCTNIVKLSMIVDTGNFLLKYMGLFFVPLVVGIMDSFELIQDNFLQLLIILVISCISVMFVSCKVTDLLIIFFRKEQNYD
ncbi:holin-like protein [Sedimentibacter acidaminivorans]|uniref:Holin-like protein n=1 Tax=Sedimentibacter acidaminivorans TaxID=913099 RepID=A0ABS4GF39_9FIRM|nr:CidA/LrgA family protein [Sedimentibacter acidaminivorans]MBP1926317.1 holin-like protein [Sedimentibacter acidaminivorans]